MPIGSAALAIRGGINAGNLSHGFAGRLICMILLLVTLRATGFEPRDAVFLATVLPQWRRWLPGGRYSSTQLTAARPSA